MPQETEIVIRRVHTDRGSHIEPPLDNSWDALTKLRWHAAVVTHDTGVPVTVQPSDYRVKAMGRWWTLRDRYDVVYPGGAAMTGGFHDTWGWLNGFAAGVRAGGQP